jgi:hypothetical protein
MRKKSKDKAFAATVGGTLDELFNNFLMADMNAVERPERDNGLLIGIGTEILYGMINLQSVIFRFANLGYHFDI